MKMPISERRKAALDLFEAAKKLGNYAAFKAAATALAAVVPKPGKPRKKGSRYPYPIVTATFADGSTMRMGVYSLEVKPFDWQRAIRICTSAWRTRELGTHKNAPHRHRAWLRRRNAIKAPAIVSMRDEVSGETWPAEIAEAA